MKRGYLHVNPFMIIVIFALIVSVVIGLPAFSGSIPLGDYVYGAPGTAEVGASTKLYISIDALRHKGGIEKGDATKWDITPPDGSRALAATSPFAFRFLLADSPATHLRIAIPENQTVRRY